MTLGIDLGALTVKVTTGGAVTPVPVAAGGPQAGVRAALATVEPSLRTGVCVAVPEAWLTGDVTGAGHQEDVRHECEDVAGTGPVTWTGQLAAVAALTAGRRNGRYLVCDAGGSGIRAGMFKTSAGTVEIMATQAADGGGWRGFDVAIRSQAPVWLPADWPEKIAGQEARASSVLQDAAESPEDSRDTYVYRIRGSGDPIDLLAGHVIDSFAPTLRQLKTVIAAVTSGAPPDGVVLTGALQWLPLTARAVADLTGVTALVADLGAAARGALLFARGEARLAPPATSQTVIVPAYGIDNGLLKDASVTLPWTAPFAPLPGGAVTIDRDELELTVAGQPRTAKLPGLAPGPHRVGVRPAWPGPGVLVVRPVTGDRAHIVPLASLTTP